MTNQTQALADALRERRVRMLNYILEWQRNEPVEDWWPYQRDYKLFSDNLSLIIEALAQYEKSDTDGDQLREAAEECRATAKKLRDCPNCDCSMAYEATLWDQRANRFEDAALASKTAIDPVTVANAAKQWLAEVLSAHDEYDTQLCCDGRECGCQGSTAFQSVQHYFDQNIDAAIRALGKDQ